MEMQLLRPQIQRNKMQAHLGYSDQPRNEGAGKEELGTRANNNRWMRLLRLKEYQEIGD